MTRRGIVCSIIKHQPIQACNLTTQTNHLMRFQVLQNTFVIIEETDCNAWKSFESDNKLKEKSGT